MTSSFSIPPIRCSTPGVPGIAHGRTRRSSRRNGAKFSGSVRNLAWIGSRSSRSGRCHGSAPLASEPSDRYATGHMCSIASRTASIAMSKHSAGVAGATTAIGHSPLRPTIACSRSACSVLVGMPVDGPARCTFTTTSGSSTDTARPMPSCFSAKPGPDVPVMPIDPPNDAPIAAPTAAISSSAWKVVTP